MTPKASILVLANRTALSAGLEMALRERAEAAPVMFTLLVPIGHSPDAQATAERLAASLREGGLEVRGIAGDTDPLCAVMETYRPGDFDEIIVSTLPGFESPWMQSGLPQRIRRQTGALVHHVQAPGSARVARHGGARNDQLGEPASALRV